MTTDVDDPHAARHGGADWLSLALMDARNHTLRWLSAFESRPALHQSGAGRSAALLVARAGQYQDRWIGRHVQRQRGEACDPGGPLLAPADAAIDGWLAGAGGATAPDADALRGYLATTLDTTLDLLAAATPSDAGLHFFRQSLRHEDRLGEALAELAGALQMPMLPGLAEAPPPRPAREPIWLPAQTLLLGSPRGGTVPDGERWQHPVPMPETEIDAQPVSWARYVEFAEDGGYDSRGCWSDAGWDWLQRQQRRAPRDVEQLRGAVLVQRGGRMQRAAAGQPVLHVSRHEAEAWCRWAGRRLPTEPEWELAATSAVSRGFVWGDVFEWVAGSARPWPGHAQGPGTLDAMPAPRTAGVLRGASWLTRRRCRHAQARRFVAPDSDAAHCGFRSAAP